MDSVFRDLYMKYHQDLYQFLFYMVKNKEETEDLVQDVYVRVMKSYSRFEGKSTEKTWLFSIAKNVAIDHFRKQRSWKEKLYDKFDWDRQEIRDHSPLPDEEAMQNEEVRQLYECLELCNTNQKLVLVMRYLNGFSISETSEALGWSESKVKTTQHRALKALKEKMDAQREKEGEKRASV